MALSLGVIGLVGLLAVVFLPKVTSSVGGASGSDPEATERLREEINKPPISSDEITRPKMSQRENTQETMNFIRNFNNDDDDKKSSDDWNVKAHSAIKGFGAGAILGSVAGAREGVQKGFESGTKWLVIGLSVVGCIWLYRKVKK